MPAIARLFFNSSRMPRGNAPGCKSPPGVREPARHARSG
jgi:hypothetical protein